VYCCIGESGGHVEYEMPYYDMVGSDPTCDEMCLVVAINNRRPKVSPLWQDCHVSWIRKTLTLEYIQLSSWKLKLMKYLDIILNNFKLNITMTLMLQFLVLYCCHQKLLGLHLLMVSTYYTVGYTCICAFIVGLYLRVFCAFLDHANLVRDDE